MKKKNRLPIIIFLGGHLLGPGQALSDDLLVDLGDTYINSVIYTNAYDEQITNHGTLLNTFAIDTSGWLVNTGTFTNLGVVQNFTLGTVLNHQGGVFDNGNQSAFLSYLTNYGTFTNYSTVNNYSHILSQNFSNFGLFVNHSLLGGLSGGVYTVSGGFGNYESGTVINNHDFSVAAGWSLSNSGIMTNNDQLDTDGQTFNYGTFTNHGDMTSSFYLDNYEGTFVNSTEAALENTGTFWNHGDFTNDGEIKNTSWFSNAEGATLSNNGAIDNQGTLRNYGAFDNSGNIVNDTLAQNTGDFMISGTLTGAGNFEQNDGTTTVNGLLSATDILVNGGILKGTGTVNGNVVVGPDGEISPGNSPGTLVIDGNLSLVIGGLLKLEVSGTGLGEFDKLIISGLIGLQGDIQISLLSGYLLDDFLANFNIGDFFLLGDETSNQPLNNPLLFAGAMFTVWDGNLVSDLWLGPDGGWSDRAPTDDLPAPATSLLMGLGIFTLYRRRWTGPGSPRIG